ncbi:MAG: hypothetical protein ACYC21_14370, partial [Eubacteriales bacterium]
MRSANEERRVVWLPFVMLGYLETLRRATFHAFGWSGRGQALAVISAIVVIHVFLDYYYPSRLRRTLMGFAGLMFIAMVWVVNKSYIPGKQSFFGGYIFGLPNFGVGSISSMEYAAFCFFVVFFYALVVFLLTSFILEKKSIAEVFFAGIFLLGVEIVASDRGILTYVILNVVFSTVLSSQVYLLQLENDHRARPVKGSGINTTTWTTVSLVLVVCLITVTAILPVGSTKVDFNTVGSNLIKQVSGIGPGGVSEQGG